MKTLLVLNASGRVTRSVTRRLTNRFAESWLAANPDGRVLQRDLGLNPPPPVSERWIAAAFTAPEERSDTANEALRVSEALIKEIDAADSVLFGTPIYNFGMPAQLKAFFDQIVRVGRTFEFTPNAVEHYRPLLSPKPVIIVISAGDAALHLGGALAHLNYLEPHLQTVLGFVGLTDVTFVRVGDEEHGGDGFKRSLAIAESALDDLACQVIRGSQFPQHGLSSVIAIAAGQQFSGHSLALKQDGTVVAWGDNSVGTTDPIPFSDRHVVFPGDT